MTISSRTSELTLAAFEQRWPGHAPRTACRLDAAGYATMWSAEIHGSTQNPNPVLTAAMCASATKHIRVGASVALHYWNALRLAKDLHLLDLVHPRRIEVALTPGSFANDATGAALRARQGEPSYFEKCVDVLRYLGTPPDTGDGRGVSITRATETRVKVWVCTVNMDRQLNSRLIALAGANALGLMLRLPSLSKETIGDAANLTAEYREAFSRSGLGGEPVVAILCPALCDESDQKAHETWSRIRLAGDSGELAALNPGVVPRSPDAPVTFPIGGPESCRDQLTEVGGRLGATEILLSCIGETFDGILDSYSMLASAFSSRKTKEPDNAQREVGLQVAPPGIEPGLS